MIGFVDAGREDKCHHKKEKDHQVREASALGYAARCKRHQVRVWELEWTWRCPSAAQIKVDDWESVPPFNETALMQALTMRVRAHQTTSHLSTSSPSACTCTRVPHHSRVRLWRGLPLLRAHAQPVVTAVCCGANLDDWHHYDGGVFDLPCCSNALVLDHAIVLAGYGTTEDGEQLCAAAARLNTLLSTAGSVPGRTRFLRRGDNPCFGVM